MLISDEGAASPTTPTINVIYQKIQTRIQTTNTAPLENSPALNRGFIVNCELNAGRAINSHPGLFRWWCYGAMENGAAVAAAAAAASAAAAVLKTAVAASAAAEGSARTEISTTTHHRTQAETNLLPPLVSSLR